MTETFGKLSPYEILNNLIPGILFCGCISWLFDIKIQSENVFDIICIFCLTYIVGLIVSRIGSLCLEPIAKKNKFIVWNKNFYRAEKNDAKLSVLLRDMNTYRTLTTGSFLLALATIITIFYHHYQNLPQYILVAVTLLLISIIFLFSYKKQSDAIFKRVEGHIKK